MTQAEKTEAVIRSSARKGDANRAVSHANHARELAKKLDDRSRWEWDEATEQLFWQPDSATVYHCSKKGKTWSLFQSGWGGSRFDTFAQLDSFATKHYEKRRAQATLEIAP